MIIFVMLFVILNLGSALKIKLKISIEESIFIAMFGMVLLAYILGLINLLGISFYIISLLTIVSLVYVINSLLKKEINLKQLITLPIIIYTIVMLILYYFIKDSKFGYYDEYMFWGYNLKEMLNNSCLWASYKIDGIHLTYPPFTAVAEYVFCQFNGGFSEPVAYLAIDTLMLTSLMPLLKNEQYKIKSFVKIVGTIALTYIALILFNYNIVNLSVDCILGILFGVSMYFVYASKENKDYITLIILLISLTLIKTNGILLAGIVIMQVFLKEIFSKEKFKKALKKAVMLLLAIIITFGSWQIYCKLNGKVVDDRHDKNDMQNIDVVEFINAIFLKDTASERNKSIVIFFWNSLLNEKVVRKFSKYSTVWVASIIDVLFLIYLIISKNKLKKLASFISMNFGFILYLLTTLLMFIFVFQEHQGDILMGFERYVATYLLAMILNSIYIIFENLNWFNGLILVGIAYLITPTRINALMADPRRIIKTEISTSIIESANEIIANTNVDDKVYIIDQNLDYGTSFMELRYLILPRKTNLLYEWNIGVTDEGVYYKTAISKEEFIKTLINEEYDYLYVISSDKNFIDSYGDLFTEEAKEKLESVIAEDVEFGFSHKNGVLFQIDKEKELIY